MSFLTSCRELFGTDDLYAVLGIDKDASDAAVKQAYRKLSLKVHPDRVEEDQKELSTKKFQIISKVHCILSDSETRKVYDETGEIDEDSEASQDRDWQEYWRLLHPKISLDDIKAFERKYKGSTEELADLTSAYLDFEGDMNQILENVMCAEIDDEPRFRELLNKLIKKGDVPDFDAFSKEKKSKKTARKRKAEQEADEAEQHKKDLGLDATTSLQAMIQSRQASRKAQTDNFLDQLAEKYAKPQKSKSRKKGK